MCAIADCYTVCDFRKRILMSNLRVSFLAGGFGFQPVDQTVLGSFVWDTQTKTLSQVELISFGPYTVSAAHNSAQFAPPPPNYPAGSLIFFNFQDAKGDVNFQMNFGDHSYQDPPIVPTGPGIYSKVPFDIGGVGVGRNAAGTGTVIVTVEK
jgi:hypothetical protein